MIGLELRDQAAVAPGLDDRCVVIAGAEPFASDDPGAAALDVPGRVALEFR